MDFPKSISIDASEKYLTSLEVNEGDDLCFPVGTTNYAFGGLAAAIQAVNTWVRRSETRRISLRSSDVVDVVEDLVSKPHKFVAAMSARSIVNEREPNVEVRPQVNLMAKKTVEEQAKRQFGQQRGGLCWFAFVDHSSKGFDRNFYIEKRNSNPEPRQEAQFKAIIRAMTQKSISVPGGAIVPENEKLDCLGRIFYELFLNTHEHGSRKEIRSKWLKPGVRVIYAQGINLSETGTRNITNQQRALSDYVESIGEKFNVYGNRRFLELGIVDSGLGYCRRWLADHPTSDSIEDLSVQDEYEIFRKCFKFRQTSTSRGNKGNGLPVVMDRLTKLNGFMRVRSGRLSVYRDFVAAPYDEDEECMFYDWVSRFSAEKALTQMAETSGVAISLLIPLEAKI